MFSFFNSIQQKGDFIGSASFKDELRTTTAYQNLINFLNKNVSEKDRRNYQTIPDSYYHDLENYKVRDQQDYFKLSKKYHNPIRLARDLILNENFCVLEKIN